MYEPISNPQLGFEIGSYHRGLFKISSFEQTALDLGEKPALLPVFSKRTVIQVYRRFWGEEGAQRAGGFPLYPFLCQIAVKEGHLD
jgi:hypothetical protein